MCKCDCGNETIVVGGRLNYGTTKSCGCLKREITSIVRKKHNTYDYQANTVLSIRQKAKSFGLIKRIMIKLKIIIGEKTLMDI